MQYSWRFFTLAVVLVLGMVVLTGRMLDLSVFNRNFLLKQSDARIIRTDDIPAYRGMMTDRNDVPLAISAPVDSIWINPQIFKINTTQLTQLAAILKQDPREIAQRINTEKDREFVYLARSQPPETAADIKALKIPGVFFQREYRRFYPSSEVTAHVLGFTNIDDNGQEGLELAFNDWLHGIPGKRQVVKDRLGQIVSNLGVLRQPQEGRDLNLSLDTRIQYLAYVALQNAVPKFHAESGSIVVLDVTTGEILAMANYPSYNPNARSLHDSRYRNRAATDLFEPGSTMKAFSIASALNSGKYKPTSIIDTRPGWLNINGRVIHDDDNYGVIDVTQVLVKSSNVGVSKMTLSLPPENLWNMLTNMGFGQRTDCGFPGEASGVLVKDRIKRPTDLATMAYGYGLSVTALQLVQAYSVLANHGIKKPLTFVKATQPASGKQVLDPNVATQMLAMLKAVADNNGGQARISGYQVGGKTGTSYIMGPHGYIKNRYNSSFIGIAPLSSPRLIVAVVLHGVQGNIHFGAQVSAPVFATIMGSSLRFMNIPPDDLKPQLQAANE